MNESLVADSLAFETGWSGLSQNGSAFKAEQSPQHKLVSRMIRLSRADGPPSHTDHLIPLWKT
jgi:hypothetical protein